MKFEKNERILVTGGTGFIGKELIQKLSQDYVVHSIERYVTGRYGLDANKNNAIMHYATLTDYSAIRNIIKKVKPDIVIHLASISAVSFSYDNYMEVNETNYLGSMNLAESCYREVPNFKQFITAGTSEMYGTSLKDKNEKLSEESKLSPNSPYAIAKTAFNSYLHYMHEAYDFPFTELRPFNSYGRRNNKHFFIERTITQALENNNIYLGDPTTIRDWLYVDDHVEGYLKALGNDKAIGQSINLCTGIGYTTEATANLISELTNFKGEIIWNATQQRPLDAQILIGDNTKARELLNWKPNVSLREGLEKTIDFWKNVVGK
ncbi:MAG: NAD-dependent epimerase/dehydratase family protein [Gammaproteobacteria bacterium]